MGWDRALHVVGLRGFGAGSQQEERPSFLRKPLKSSTPWKSSLWTLYVFPSSPMINCHATPCQRRAPGIAVLLCVSDKTDFLALARATRTLWSEYASRHVASTAETTGLVASPLVSPWKDARRNLRPEYASVR